jgi:hypothetical protein
MSKYSLDRYAGCTFKISAEEVESGQSIAQMAANDRARGIYNPLECVTGDDKSFYSFEWRRAAGSRVTVKQGIANRRALLGF